MRASGHGAVELVGVVTGIDQAEAEGVGESQLGELVGGGGGQQRRARVHGAAESGVPRPLGAYLATVAIKPTRVPGTACCRPLPRRCYPGREVRF
jgi:hypothetical protein